MRTITKILGNAAFMTALAGIALTGCPSKSGNGGGGTGGTGGGGGGGGTINIAVAGPMTGSAAAFGAMIKRGAELAQEQINAKGGINGTQVGLIVEDDKGLANEAVNVARKLAADTTVPIIVGHFNSVCSNAAKEEYNDVKVVSLSPGSTNVNVCKGYPYTFRNLYRDDYQGVNLAKFIKTQLNGQKVAVFYDNDDYGKGLMQFFVENAKKEGLEVLEPIQYQRERTDDFKSLVTQVVDAKPDTIFVSGLYNEGALICKAARIDLGMKDVNFVGGDGLVSPGFLKTAGAAGEGAFVSTPFYYDEAKASQAAKDFYTSFKKKFNEEPDTWAALTFDAVMMAAKAIEVNGPDREKIKNWMAGITTPDKGYKGVTGNTYFDNEGDCLKPLAFVEVKGGKFVLSDKQLK